MTGVYFLLQDSKVVYIGQTKNIKQRLVNHYVYFDSYRFMPCDINRMNEYETRWLKRFRPQFNKIMVGAHNPFSMSGRKSEYNPETLEIGQKMDIKAKNRKFGHQYAYGFSKRLTPKRFKFVEDQIERVA